MYSIYADDTCIYNDAYPLDNMKIVSPKLTMEDSSAGTLEMTIPSTNIGYDTMVRMVSDIVVKRNGTEIWDGRILSEDKDFWNNRVMTCEGSLAFLNDTTQPPKVYSGVTVRSFLTSLIAVHNAKVPANRQFTVGSVTVTDPSTTPKYITNYEKTIEVINDLVENLGGHLRVRKVDGVRYLDYLEDYPNTNTQTIEFGTNLLDFTRTWDMTDFATVILPLGEQLDESENEDLEEYLTVASVNGGSVYVENSDAEAEYGWIEKVVNWDDVTDASELLEKAQLYLSDIQFDNMTIELNALDMHYLNVDVEAVKLLDQIRVISVPHGMDRYFPVTKLEIPLDEPENTEFTLGDDIKASLTSVNNSTNSEILKKIENLPKTNAILEQAKENATSLINMATNGYITIEEGENGAEALHISDTLDYTESTKLWTWNVNGLGYSADGGETYSLAMTMDGSIVADFITTGTLNAAYVNVINIDINSITYTDDVGGNPYPVITCTGSSNSPSIVIGSGNASYLINPSSVIIGGSNVTLNAGTTTYAGAFTASGLIFLNAGSIQIGDNSGSETVFINGTSGSTYLYGTTNIYGNTNMYGSLNMSTYAISSVGAIYSSGAVSCYSLSASMQVYAPNVTCSYLLCTGAMMVMSNNSTYMGSTKTVYLLNAAGTSAIGLTFVQGLLVG